MIKELLLQSKWRVFNVSVAKKIGLHETLVLMEIADAEQAFKGEDFYLTYDKISENTTLSEKQIRKAVKELKKLGIIDTKMKGVPAKQYFYILNLDILKDERSIPAETDSARPTKKGRSIPAETDSAIYKEPIIKKPTNKKPKPKKPKYDLLNIHQRIPDYIYEDYTDEQVKQRNILVAEELLNSTTWMDTVGRLANLQPELINKKVKEFLLKIEAGRECFNTLSEIKRHFSNWIKTNKTLTT